jgi:hypothetical protein
MRRDPFTALKVALAKALSQENLPILDNADAETGQAVRFVDHLLDERD